MKPKTNLPCVVSIAGTDPSGGAGIQADIKAISATGSYAASVITVLVAQNTQGVKTVYPISAEFVKDQLQCVFEDLTIHAVKIGMLYRRDIIEVVADAIDRYKPANVVLDPVMTAKDASFLLEFADLDYLQQSLFPRSYLITPNLFETQKIMNQSITSLADMEHAAKSIGQHYQVNTLIKGGHLCSSDSSDVLYSYQDQSIDWFHSKRIHTHNTHGTGCTLSSAIASFLAQNYPLQEAIQRGKDYLTHAIHAGSKIQIGQGNGPVDHFYFLR